MHENNKQTLSILTLQLIIIYIYRYIRTYFLFRRTFLWYETRGTAVVLVAMVIVTRVRVLPVETIFSGALIFDDFANISGRLYLDRADFRTGVRRRYWRQSRVGRRESHSSPGRRWKGTWLFCIRFVTRRARYLGTTGPVCGAIRTEPVFV